MREGEIEKYKQVWIDRETSKLLKEEKKRLADLKKQGEIGEGKSMMRLTKEAVFNYLGEKDGKKKL